MPDNPYATPDLSAATRTAYARDLASFHAFCEAHDLTLSMPAEPSVIAAYLASIARTHATATLRRRLRGIAAAHLAAGYDFPSDAILVRQTMRGIARAHGTPPRRAAALGLREVRAMLIACDETLTGLRDRAVILIGFAGGLRRSEITAIEREHVTFQPGSIRLHIPSSKSDQGHDGAEIVIPAGVNRMTCPVRTLQRWLDVSVTRYGPVFRGIDRWGVISDQALHPDGVRRIVLRAAERAGIKVAVHETLSPHGLRAGFVTEAHRAGARDEDIAGHTRHKSLASMRGYIRRSGKLSDNPAGKLGL